MAISVTVKRRKKIDTSVIIQDLIDELHRHASHVLELYGQSTETWTTEPEFTGRTKETGNKYSVNLYARGQVRQIYQQIDQGFLRQAAVSEDWMSKTQPGVLRAREGRGHLLRGPNGKPVLLQTPEPVIPRHFTSMITELIRRGYFDGMAAIFKKHFEVNNG